ncbi:hypothetical protein CBS147339_5067 [Penicillium roqueforti]|nr:hypothetical protein DTO012A8_9947 [Penicillium roqueforti]KAI3076233.1 hypothetical protein CBS147339_5067 [Penicillium roqueforti]KAI3093997.1 hypothetical protein CBS147338_6896 [Penicillium roqueforti]KAI3105439.1 hypothetical protein CBS147333_6934 [Penicillium roqueforti]KAI3179587.1 hypothetical protein DTO032C6_8817 [Penicillium roqueforti]
MSSKPTSRESKVHFAHRLALVKLHDDIEALEVHEFDASQLAKLNIKREHMSLREDSDLKPRYFAAISNIPQPTDEVIDEAVDVEGLFEDTISRSYHFERVWRHYGLEVRWECNDRVWRSKPVCKYHAFKSFGLLVDDSKLCRGELLIILRLMICQFRMVRLLHHKVAPVLVASFMGEHARMLESYFDGESLILRSSDLYHLSERKTTAEVFEAFAMWFAGNPAGETE